MLRKTSFYYFYTGLLNPASVNWRNLQNSVVLSATAEVFIQQIHCDLPVIYICSSSAEFL